MAEGIILKHDTLANALWVVENPKRPFSDGGFDCHMCVGNGQAVHHYGKATHLWLEPNGTCIVSTGVLKELRSAGMPQLTVTGRTSKPPPLMLTPGVSRQVIDNRNRKIYSPTRLGGN